MAVSRDAIRCRVLLDGQEVDYLHPLTISRSVGGTQLDHATLTVDLAHGPGGQASGSQMLRDMASLPGYGLFHPEHPGGTGEVEILATIDGEEVCLHWGKIAATSIGIRNGESLSLTSRVERHYFGKPVAVCRFVNAGVPVDAELPVVFNPQLDDVIRPNMAPPADVRPNGLFIHVGSGASAAARAYQEVEPELWTLTEAVLYLCWELNANETWITNPDRAELEEVFAETLGKIHNVAIPFGTYLPDALDRLLEPLGYGWVLEYAPGLRRIRVFQKGFGIDTADVYLQPPGARLNPSQSNVASADLTYSVTNLANIVTGLGAPAVVEGTFELKRGWGTDEESFLPVSAAAFDDYEYDKGHVWRKFVLNEAGDYNDLEGRDYETFDLFDHFDPANHFEVNEAGGEGAPEGAILARRRRFLPTVTTDTNGQPIGDQHGFTVEIKSEAVFGSGSDWQPLSKTGIPFAPLEEECGIALQTWGSNWPAIIKQDSTFAVRITASIASDRRLVCTIPEDRDTAPSMQPDEIELVLDLSHRFFYRAVVKDSKYASLEYSQDRTTNDWAKLKEFMLAVYSASNLAPVYGSLVIEGINWPQYVPGVSLGKIAGREISLITNPLTYSLPTISAVTWDVQHQRTTLRLETVRPEPPL